MENKSNIGKVCVTGANGFVASWLVKRLLESGYHVTGTVRDPGDCKKNGHLMELEGAKERLHLMRADLTEEGSFDDAVMGCEGVFHIASPVYFGPMSDPKAEIIDPAVKGTLNVLRSCKKNSKLKKVVLTSSVAAVSRPAVFPEEAVLDETSWSSTEVCEKLKLWYAISKILAERAAWDFAEQNNINLVTVLPSWVLGSSLPHNLKETASVTLSLLKGDSWERFLRNGKMGFVHIDDVARCHVLVYEDDTAQGRYLCTSSTLDTLELAAFLAKHYPWLPIPSSFPNYEDRLEGEYNTSKVEKLGIRFKGIKEMFDDFIQSMKRQGYLP